MSNVKLGFKGLIDSSNKLGIITHLSVLTLPITITITITISEHSNTTIARIPNVCANSRGQELTERYVPVVPAGLDRPNHGVLRPPPPPPVIIPPFTPEQLNNAAAVALEKIRQRLEFVASLFANNVIVQVSTVR